LLALAVGDGDHRHSSLSGFARPWLETVAFFLFIA